MQCFFESEDYESAIRNVMYIGGDCDTLGAIVGAVAGPIMESQNGSKKKPYP